MYSLYLLRRAEQELEAIPSIFRERIDRVISQPAQDPRPSGVKKLRGGIGWRLRIGDHRVAYEIDHQGREITVVKGRHRKNVYRGGP